MQRVLGVLSLCCSIVFDGQHVNHSNRKAFGKLLQNNRRMHFVLWYFQPHSENSLSEEDQILQIKLLLSCLSENTGWKVKELAVSEGLNWAFLHPAEAEHFWVSGADQNHSITWLATPEELCMLYCPEQKDQLNQLLSHASP